MSENFPSPFVNLTPLRLQSSPFEKYVLQLVIWAIQIFQIEQPKQSAGKLSAEGGTWFKMFVFINLALLFLLIIIPHYFYLIWLLWELIEIMLVRALIDTWYIVSIQ